MSELRKERVLVAGAGIAGLGAALALGDGTREITILDRDPPPPELSPDEAFYRWERKGATQLRHSHAFIGKLTALIRERYPDLLAELLGEGTRLFEFADALPPTLKTKYKRAAGDGELMLLFSRRTTLELAMRRYAARLPGVRFVSNAAVRGLLFRREEGKLFAAGLQMERDGELSDIHADLVIDASGRNSAFPEWLRKAGVEIREDESPCGILYFTRHYRLRDGQEEPPADGTPGAGDLGYIKFGVFVADNRHFSVTLATPEIETELRKAIVRPDVFDAICTTLPGAARWMNAARAEPVSQVFAMGNLQNVWRHYLKDDAPQVLGFFAIGDAAIRTNPLYGRGCASGILEAHLLRDALDATPDPAARARAFDRKVHKAVRPYFDSMAKLDLQAIRRAAHERDPDYRPCFRARLMKSFAEDGLVPAQRADIEVSRAMSRIFHMVEEPAVFARRPDIVARILKVWATPKSRKRTRGWYPPAFGPERSEMFAQLGLAAI